jgi:glycosyltransferase involved in cell wall biosynthesis
MKRRSIALFYYSIVSDNAIGRCNRIVLEGLCDKYDFTVFAVKFDNPRPDRIRWVRVRSIERPAPVSYIVFRILARIAYLGWIVANGRRFDLVVASDGCIDGAHLAHAHFCHRFYLKRLVRLRDLLSLRGLNSAIDHFVRAVWEGQLYRRAGHVVVPSDGLRQELIENYNVKPQNVSVIANPLDLVAYSPRPEERLRVRGELHLADEDFVCVFVALGHFKRKGLGELIEALASPLLNGVRLLVVGGSSSATAPYRKRAEQLQIASRIVFCGHHTDTRPFLWAADAFVLPSRYETFSIVATEAAACGLPVITTALHGVRDWAHSGITGFMLEDSTTSAIVTSVKMLIDLDPAERRRLGDNARSAVMRYGVENYLVEFDQQYRQALANRKVWSRTRELDRPGTLKN